VTTILDELSTNVEMSTLTRTSDAVFYPLLEELCASSPVEGRTRGTADDDSVRILGKSESKDPEFQKAKTQL
jgi:hypothetical protein